MTPPVPDGDRLSSRAKFILGIVGGTVFSGICYAIVVSGLSGQGYLMLAPITLKLVGGVGLSFFPQWRALGAGLLASAAVVLLIMMTLCYGTLVALR